MSVSYPVPAKLEQKFAEMRARVLQRNERALTAKLRRRANQTKPERGISLRLMLARREQKQRHWTGQNWKDEARHAFQMELADRYKYLKRRSIER